MADERIRRQVALLAARLMYERQESEYFTAKRKAARQLGVDYKFRPGDLPSNREIRDQIQGLANLYEGHDARNKHIADMRLEALRMMRLLSAFRPRLIGSVLTGHVRKGSDVDLHVFSDNLSSVTTVLDDENLTYTVQHKRIRKHNEDRVFTHLHVAAKFNFELTLYGTDKVNYPFKSSITGRLIERATIPELEELIRREHPDADLDAAEAGVDALDRFELYRLLLEPLERVKQDPRYHPEGDALYHTLQVFELARDRVPWDEEFLLAALLHDVGKAIDPADHPGAAVAALEGTVTDRTAFLIAHHMDALAYNQGTLGHRAKERLRASEHFEDLMLLRELDTAGRQRGVGVCTVNEALAYVRALEQEPGDGY